MIQELQCSAPPMKCIWSVELDVHCPVKLTYYMEPEQANQQLVCLCSGEETDQRWRSRPAVASPVPERCNLVSPQLTAPAASPRKETRHQTNPYFTSTSHTRCCQSSVGIVQRTKGFIWEFGERGGGGNERSTFSSFREVLVEWSVFASFICLSDCRVSISLKWFAWM